MTRAEVGSTGEAAESWDALVERAHGLLDVVSRLAGRHLRRSDIGDGHPSLDAALGWAEGFLRVRGAVLPRREGIDGPRVAQSLLVEVMDLRHRLMTRVMAARSEMMQRVDHSLQRLRLAETVEALTSQLPAEVVALGYVRSLFSWADAGLQWVAQSAHSMLGPEESRRLVDAGRQEPFRDLRDLYEYEMIRERRPILQRGIRKSTHVHPELVKVTESESYVASPVIVGDSVAGFVSLDVNASTGSVDEFDRDLMGIFTAGAGLALERVRRQQGEEPASAEEFEAWSHLTSREREILELLAHGHTNAGIAGVLFISEGTAKTHVRNVMNKLGVSNRTLAAAVYQRVQRRG